MINEKPWNEGSQPQITKIWPLPFEQDENPGCIACWLAYAPWCHPAWDWHFIGLVHLRPLNDDREARLQFDGATHELHVVALDPRNEPTKLDPTTFSYLAPVSIAQQFIADSDAQALEVCEKCLGWVAEVRLSLDSDFRRHWRHVLYDRCPEIWE